MNNKTLQIIPLEIEYINQAKSILDLQFGFDYITVSNLKSKIQDNNSICIIAINDKEVVGISIAVMGKAKRLSNHLLKEKDWFVTEFKNKNMIGLRKQMAVKPGFEGKGIGTKLIKESMRLLIDSCDTIITIVWCQGDELIMNKLMIKNHFKSKIIITNYWKNDSIEKQYICPACKAITCVCSAHVYVREILKD